MENVSGCVVAIEDLPEGALCGIDLLSFTTSSRFRGVKLVPAGWHFFYAGQQSAFSLRQGVWFHVNVEENALLQLHLFKWLSDREELVAVQDADAIAQWRSDLPNVWRDGLTPYRQVVPKDSPIDEEAFVEETNEWAKLTDCISSSLLSRIVPNESGPFHVINSASYARIDAEDIPGLAENNLAGYRKDELLLLPIDLKQTWPEGAIGRERTDAAKDRSWALQNLIQQQDRTSRDIIGELQMVFILVLTLNNNSCLEQWRRILGLVLTCKNAIASEPDFFVHLLETVKLQLEHCSDAEGGLFDLSEDAAGHLKGCFRRFRENVNNFGSAVGVSHVASALSNLEDLLSTEFGWAIGDSQVRRGMLQLDDGEEILMDLNGVDEEDESGEYAPAMADIDPELEEEWRLLKSRGMSAG